MKIVLKVRDGLIGQSISDQKDVEILVIDLDNPQNNPDAAIAFDIEGEKFEATAELFETEVKPEVVDEYFKTVGE